MARRSCALAALFWMATLGACQGDDLPPPDVVARLVGFDIRYSEFETYLATNLGVDGNTLDSEVLSGLFDQFLDETLLARLALDRDLVEASTDHRLAVDALLDEQLGAAAVTEGQVRSEFDQRRAELQRPETIRLLQILTEDEATARQAREEILAGADFEAVAQRLSQAPARPLGGDGGSLGREDLPPAFADRLFRLAPGEISEILPADYGFFLFKVLEVRPSQTLSFAEAEPELRAQIERRRTDEALAGLVLESRKRYGPKIYERNLPFNYYGRYSSATG